MFKMMEIFGGEKYLKQNKNQTKKNYSDREIHVKVKY